jgi:hypothetical protein
VSTPPAFASTLKPGKKVEGPIQITDAIAVAYYYLGQSSTDTLLFGEVENTSDAPAVTPLFQVQGLDENGDPYGDTSYLISEPIVLAPGERTVINGVVDSGLPPESFGSVAFTATEPFGTHEPLPITIEGIPARGKTKDVATKKGMLRNTGDSVIDVDILVSWFAPDGTTLGSCFGTSGGSIPPDKTLPIQSIAPVGGCSNVMEGAKALGVSESDDTGYAVQVYSSP